jgi:IS1 family transposase
MTLVDRSTRCIVGWRVGDERSEAVLQALVDTAPQAVFYFSDSFPTYDALIYKPGIHLALLDKSQTYSVEGDNAELRHYLARLGRRSRCFSRCVKALARAVKLLVYAWNRRQLYRLDYPDYPAHVCQFV